MRKLILGAILLFSTLSFSQEKYEPQFLGDVVIVPSENVIKAQMIAISALTPFPASLALVSDMNAKNNQLYLLKREYANFNTKSDMGLLMLGVVSVKTKLVISGNYSPNKLHTGTYTFVIKTNDNNINPLDFIKIVKLKSNSKKRTAELSSIGSFSGLNDGKEVKIDYIAEKYGTSSYKIIVNFTDIGEYCFIIGGKDDFAMKSISISTLSISN